MSETSRRQFLQRSLALASLGLLMGCVQVQPPATPTNLPPPTATPQPIATPTSPPPATSTPLPPATPTPLPITRIGVLGFGTFASERFQSIQQELNKLGHIEGQTTKSERRIVSGGRGQNRLDGPAAELVNAPVAMILAIGSEAALAAKQATQAIPILMIGTADPIALGLVASLERPGGNVTGLTLWSDGLSAKRLQLLQAVIPSLKRVAILWSSGDTDSKLQFGASEQAAKALGLDVYSVDMPVGARVSEGFAKATQAQAEAVLALDDSGALGNYTDIANAALEHKLPVMADDRTFTKRLIGGLMAYGPNGENQSQRAAAYADRLIHGASPASLPIEQPGQIDFTINLQTAKTLGLTIPQGVLDQATEIL